MPSISTWIVLVLVAENSTSRSTTKAWQARAVTVAPTQLAAIYASAPQAANPIAANRGVPYLHAARVSWPIVSIPHMGDGVSRRGADPSAQFARGPRWVAGSPAYDCRSPPCRSRYSPPPGGCGWRADPRAQVRRMEELALLITNTSWRLIWFDESERNWVVSRPGTDPERAPHQVAPRLACSVT